MGPAKDEDGKRPAASPADRSGRLGDFLPIARWLPNYHRAWFKRDLIAGVALAGLLVPESMGNAGIAGMPPQTGLYAALAGLFLYALFGTSRHLSMAATSATAIMIAATVGPLAGGDPGRYATLTAALVLLAGLIFLAAGAARLGFVSDFIARPVVTGFIFGLALTIILRQVPKLLGVPKGEGGFFQMARQIVGELDRTSLPTLAIAIAAFAVLILIDRWARPVPGALAALIAGIAVVSLLDLEAAGVAVVGAVPGGLPDPALPRLAWADIGALLPGAVGLVLVDYAQGLGAARTFASRHGYSIDADQELKAAGLANLGSGLLGGIAVGGGLSGSSANEAGGARSELSTLAASGFILLTLLFLTPLFHNLPEAVLGAIIIFAVRKMLNAGEILRFAQIRRTSLALSLTALLGVLVFDVLPGLIIAVTLSLVALIRGLSRPRIALLGRRPGQRAWVDVGLHAAAEPVPRLAICRIHGLLFFASADAIGGSLKQLLLPAGRTYDAAVLDFEMLFDLDVTAALMLDDLLRDLSDAGIAAALSNVHSQPREILKRSGLIDRLGAGRLYPTIDEAVAVYRRRREFPTAADAQAPEKPPQGRAA